MPYYIYRITSPSKKVYIGLTKNVKERWRLHKGKAHRSKRKRHPLLDAILCYGDSNFTVETLSVTDDIELAKKEEMKQILKHSATDRSKGYNISPGGDYDGIFGPKIFWEKMRSDPVAFAVYRKNLSKACKKRGPVNLAALLKYQRNLPAKERWKQAYRASRVAAKNSYPRRKGHTLTAEHILKMTDSLKLSWVDKPPSEKRRHAMAARNRTKELWAKRTDVEKEDLSKSISATLKKRYVSNQKFRAHNFKQIATARNSIDRSVQAPAASKGLKKFWADIKKDPERYKAYLQTRSATRRRQLNAKNDI